jgi:hypothetical protein
MLYRASDLDGFFGILTRNQNGKIPFGRPRHKWKGNIKLGFKELQPEDMERILLAQDKPNYGLL